MSFQMRDYPMEKFQKKRLILGQSDCHPEKMSPLGAGNLLRKAFICGEIYGRFWKDVPLISFYQRLENQLPFL